MLHCCTLLTALSVLHYLLLPSPCFHLPYLPPSSPYFCPSVFLPPPSLPPSSLLPPSLPHSPPLSLPPHLSSSFLPPSPSLPLPPSLSPSLPLSLPPPLSLLLPLSPLAYQFTYPCRVIDVLSEWGCIIVLLRDGKVSTIWSAHMCDA